MAKKNQVLLIGKVSRNPVSGVRHSKACSLFSVQVERFADSGTKDIIPIEAYEKNSIVAEGLLEGDVVKIEGELRTESRNLKMTCSGLNCKHEYSKSIMYTSVEAFDIQKVVDRDDADIVKFRQNNVFLLGITTKEPDFFPSSTYMGRYTSEKAKYQLLIQSKNVDNPDLPFVTSYGQEAVEVHEEVKKGDKVFIDGYLFSSNSEISSDCPKCHKKNRKTVRLVTCISNGFRVFSKSKPLDEKGKADSFKNKSILIGKVENLQYTDSKIQFVLDMNRSEMYEASKVPVVIVDDKGNDNARRDLKNGDIVFVYGKTSTKTIHMDVECSECHVKSPKMAMKTIVEARNAVIVADQKHADRVNLTENYNIFIGRVIRNPEFFPSEIKSGNPTLSKAKFQIEVGRNGQSVTPYILSYGRLAEVDAERVQGGTLMCVDGRISTIQSVSKYECEDCGNITTQNAKNVNFISLSTEYLQDFVYDLKNKFEPFGIRF